MELDIDRVHEVIEGKYPGERGAGHTTAMLTQIIQAAELVEGTYAVVVLNRTMLDYVIDLMEEVYLTIYPNNKITIIRRNGFVEFGKSKIKFVSQTNIDRSMCGIHLVNYYVDNPVVLSHSQYLILQAATYRNV